MSKNLFNPLFSLSLRTSFRLLLIIVTIFLEIQPLTDGDVGHYNKKTGESNPLEVFDRPCDAEGLNILAWSHEFSKLYFSSG